MRKNKPGKKGKAPKTSEDTKSQGPTQSVSAAVGFSTDQSQAQTIVSTATAPSTAQSPGAPPQLPEGSPVGLSDEEKRYLEFMRQAMGITRLEQAFNEMGQALKAHLETSTPRSTATTRGAEPNLAVPGLPGGLGGLISGLDVPKIIQGVLDKLLGGGGGEANQMEGLDRDVFNAIMKETLTIKKQTSEIAGMLITNLQSGGQVLRDAEGNIVIKKGATLEAEKKN